MSEMGLAPMQTIGITVVFVALLVWGVTKISRNAAAKRRENDAANDG